ncbi:hypothetical protein CP975_34385 [Streptomyces alboniger]|uniref:Uncharacterized protein n=1 Tax=Streptomyces alboniger TaxID=132473 RepID=A0A5J6HZA2_STRAD|nr:hypothetical protein CP975_34385 [Streptomyces alboniger]
METLSGLVPGKWVPRDATSLKTAFADSRMRLNMSARMCMSMSMHVCMSMYVCMSMHVCMSMYVCMSVHRQSSESRWIHPAPQLSGSKSGGTRGLPVRPSPSRWSTATTQCSRACRSAR